MENLLSTKDLRGGYGSVQILNGVDIEVEPNEIVTIIGPNGSGKSTFLKVIFGLATYYDGEIKYENENISSVRTDLLVKKGISYVPQVENVFPSLTIHENLEMGAYLFKSKDIQDDLEHVYQLFPDLVPRKHDLTNTLSGGQRQMLALGRAMMTKPKFMFLDEPTAALSPIYVKQILDKIVELRDEEKLTILLVEQNAKSALKISDYGYILANGKVVYHNKAEELLIDKKINEYFLGVKSETK